MWKAGVKKLKLDASKYRLSSWQPWHIVPFHHSHGRHDVLGKYGELKFLVVGARILLQVDAERTSMALFFGLSLVRFETDS